MDYNFSLLNNSKKTINYINKQLVNFPKTERVLKDNIESVMYEIIELIFYYKVNDVTRIKVKYLKDLVVKLSMLDFYITASFDKKLINNKKLLSISGYIIEIRKIVYGLIKYENKV